MTTSTPPSTPQCDPAFPPELEREISESAAELYPESIPNLFLVAHRVHEWIGRIKYRTITMWGINSTCGFYALRNTILTNLRPESFFRDIVRHIFLLPWHLTPPEETLLPVLSVCTEIQSLALFVHVGQALLASTVHHAISSLKLQRLALASLGPLRDFFLIYRPMFTLVTHLELWDGCHMSWPSILDLFPSITRILISAYEDCYLTVPEDGFGLSEDALAQCPQINVIIAVGGASKISYLTGLELQWQDPRLVFVQVEDSVFPWYENEWTLGLDGKLDFWAQAETFVVKRRREKIKAGCVYLWDAQSFIEMYYDRFPLLQTH
ncbi:hypothetical protein R3P38DRAFT_2531976 [Favolaschia claudopus]|uniref:Uncharacterized protein n=1 Tax=Favolaschia claudopus TaxID=2862362 RepID=A0AAW0BBU6_9AGAR